MRKFHLTFCPLSLLLAFPALGAVLADSKADYSAVTQGHANWFYGYYDGTNSPFYTPADFKAFPHSDGAIWYLDSPYLSTPGGYWTQISSDGGHPEGAQSGKLSATQWAVRRWVPTLSGTVNVTGTYGDLDSQNTFGSNGVTLRILQGNQTLWSADIANGASIASYATQLNVTAGQPLDFAIDAKGNDYFDNTQFTATIATVPEPAAGLLLACTCAGPLLRTRATRRKTRPALTF